MLRTHPFEDQPAFSLSEPAGDQRCNRALFALDIPAGARLPQRRELLGILMSLVLRTSGLGHSTPVPPPEALSLHVYAEILALRLDSRFRDREQQFLGSRASRGGRRPGCTGKSANQTTHWLEACSNRMRISREHRLDAVPGNFGQVGVVDAGSAEVRDVRVAALMGADV